MLLRLAYLGITNAVALLRLLPGGDRDKDIEILSLRHQLAVLPRQLHGTANLQPLKSLPEPITDPDQLARLNIHRHDRLGGILHE